MTEVSLIVPLYNKRRYVRRALDSVLAQTFERFELVVVDDGSTDGGADVVREFRDSRVRLMQQSNSGPGAARNRGVRAGDSTYVAFLDADDELLPDFLQQSVSNLAAHPNCAVSVCASVRGSEKAICSPPGETGAKSGPWRMAATVPPSQLQAACVSMHVSVLMRREAFLALGGFYEKGCCFAEDSYLWLQVLLNCFIYREMTPLMWYHTEDAELNLHHTHGARHNWAELRRERPLSPILSDPDPIRRNCLGSYQALLEDYLAYEALSEALTRTSVGDDATARELRRAYPRMQQFRYSYAKLGLKLSYPGLAALARQ